MYQSLGPNSKFLQSFTHLAYVLENLHLMYFMLILQLTVYTGN